MQKIDKMLGSFTINMDPSNYRRLYRDKAFRETVNLPSVPSQSQQQTQQQVVNQGGSGYSSASPAQNQQVVGHYNVRASSNQDKQNLGGPSGSASQITAPTVQGGQAITQMQMKNMAAPATSMGLQEILTNPALQSSHVSSQGKGKMHQSLDLTL